MNMILLVLLSAASVFAQTRNTERGCSQAMDHSTKTGKPSAIIANSDAAWDAMLENQIQKARLECKGEKMGDCLSKFLDDLSACEGVGSANLQRYVEELRRSAEAHATPKSHRPRTTEVSEGAGTRK
jgi:hypothetical protein